MPSQPEDLFDHAQRTRGIDPEALLEALNEPQREAVLANDGPVLILAGAGSGKTRAITHKIAWLIAREGFKPWEILAVTFTNRAAREMRERCEQLIGRQADSLWMGTFHKIGVRMLRRHGTLVGVDQRFVIYDRKDQETMVGRVVEGLGYALTAFPARKVLNWIDRAKQRCQPPGDPALPAGSEADRISGLAYAEYEVAMRGCNAVDFGDLIYLPWRLVTENALIASEYKHRWRYILIDEFQDTNHSQYALIRAVLNDDKRVCVVGDDDQSIYSWRGAEVRNILEFGRDFAGTTVIRLEQNYRSTDNILAAARSIIACNSGRHDKTLWTDKGPGEKVQLHIADSDTSEARWVVRRIERLRHQTSLSETAIFYRTNAQSRVMEDALRRSGIPYIVVGSLRFYDRAEVKDIMAWLKVLANPADAISLERIVNRPPRGIGAGTVAKARDVVTERKGAITLFEAMRTLSTTGDKGVRKRLAPFVELIDELRALAETLDAKALTEQVLVRSGYVAKVQEDDSVEARGRLENLTELLSGIDEFGSSSKDRSLDAWLENAALVANIDSADTESEHVVMMTAHTAKGLEFDVVFLTGMEEGLFPHFNSQDTESEVEEERRLAYVAMTRARERLHLSWARYRRARGQVQECAPSPFLEALDLTKMTVSGDTPRSSFASRGAARNAPAASPRLRRRSARSDFDVSSQQMPDYEDFNQAVEGGALSPGATVFHSQFGEGKVDKISGMGPRAIVHVTFGSGERRRIMARFLTPAF